MKELWYVGYMQAYLCAIVAQALYNPKGVSTVAHMGSWILKTWFLDPTGPCPFRPMQAMLVLLDAS